MKELSIEEKAKHYDEALKLIKECTPDENGFITIYPNEIFPELKESEDERIRKWIIGILSTYEHDRDLKNAAIAYLEKQGEQKPTIEMITPEESLGIDSETYNKIVDECIYSEQKPAEWSEGDEKILQDLIDHFEYKKKFIEAEDFNILLWLKSLKDRYTWKPSEGQMDALNDVISSRDIKYDVLSELWKDLKKLREE